MLSAFANNRPTVLFLLEDSIRNEPIEGGNDRRTANAQLLRKSSAGQNRSAGQIAFYDSKQDLAINLVDRRSFDDCGYASFSLAYVRSVHFGACCGERRV